MEITLKGNPLSTNNVYVNSPGRGRFMAKGAKVLKESYQWQIKSQYKGKPITKDVDLRVELFFGDKRIRDIDNYNKLLLDACTGILWVDDSQIQSLLIIKNFDKKNPRAELTL